MPLRPSPVRSTDSQRRGDRVAAKRVARFATQSQEATARQGHQGFRPRRAMSSQRQSDRERGAALVEFALVLPLVLMLTFGMVSSALAYNHKMDLIHAAREGARYGATLPRDQCIGSPNPCGTSTWAQVVQSVVVQRSLGDVTAAEVCVALVSGNPGTTSSGFFVGS